MKPSRWLYNVLLGLDQFANALAGGSPDETISSRTGRSQTRLGRLLGGFLHLFEKDHAAKSIEFTPWGTVDPHDLVPVNWDIAADWNALIAVMDERRDLDAWPEATKDAAQRALVRLRLWDGRARWQERMERDLDVGDRFQR